MPIRAAYYLYDGNGVNIGVRLDGVSRAGFAEVRYDDISGNIGNQAWLNKFSAAMQDKIDVVDNLAALDPQEEANGPNWKNRECFFIEQGKLISRPVVFTALSWDGEKVIFSIRRANRNYT